MIEKEISSKEFIDAILWAEKEPENPQVWPLLKQVRRLAEQEESRWIRFAPVYAEQLFRHSHVDEAVDWMQRLINHPLLRRDDDAQWRSIEQLAWIQIRLAGHVDFNWERLTGLQNDLGHRCLAYQDGEILEISVRLQHALRMRRLVDLEKYWRAWDNVRQIDESCPGCQAVMEAETVLMLEQTDEAFNVLNQKVKTCVRCAGRIEATLLRIAYKQGERGRARERFFRILKRMDQQVAGIEELGVALLYPLWEADTLERGLDVLENVLAAYETQKRSFLHPEALINAALFAQACITDCIQEVDLELPKEWFQAGPEGLADMNFLRETLELKARKEAHRLEALAGAPFWIALSDSRFNKNWTLDQEIQES